MLLTGSIGLVLAQVKQVDMRTNIFCVSKESSSELRWETAHTASSTISLSSVILYIIMSQSLK